jgi:putative photosynthetic complex assembly protein 2
MQLLFFIRPVLFAIFLWWFTTGVIIAVYGRSPRLARLCFTAFTGALLVSLWGLVATRPFSDPRYVYLAFVCGLLIWGWQTASYYLGYVVGPPPKTDEPLSIKQSRRFWLALRSGLYHELVVIGFALLLFALTWSYPNRWGLWIFLAMWLMHASARLNVFLGVRNFKIEFLPSHLHHLNAYVSKQSNNLFLPISVVVASSVSLALVYRAIAPGATPGETIGYLLVATMMFLGIVEHVLLVLPIPVALWGWGVRRLPITEPLEIVSLPPQKTAVLPALPRQMVEG